MRPDAFTPDGSQLIFESGGDLFVKNLDSESPPRPLIQTEFTEGRSALSPDGRWLAYESDRTGRNEVYVVPFPAVDEGQWQISSTGGSRPRWNPNGRELFFRGSGVYGGELWMANVETDGVFQHESPVVIISGTYLNSEYDISTDGSRFLRLQSLGDDNSPIGPELTELVVVENWFEELKQLAPPDPQ
jgi:Tol biopolymer transport system component